MNHNNSITKDTRYKPCVTFRDRLLSSQLALMTYPALGFCASWKSRENIGAIHTSDCTILQGSRSTKCDPLVVMTRFLPVKSANDFCSPFYSVGMEDDWP